MSTYVKIYGLPRTCTNLVQHLIVHNFEDIEFLVNYPCWKHGLNTIEGNTIHDEEKKVHTDDLRFVSCFKSPYQWLFSLFCFERKYFKAGDDFNAFCLGNKRHHYDGQCLINIYNVYNRNYIDLPGKLVKVKECDVQDALEQSVTLETIREKLDIKPASTVYKVQEKVVSPRGKVALLKKYNTTFSFSLFEQDTLDYINERLDIDLMNELGYKIQGEA